MSYMWENGTEIITETNVCWMGQTLHWERLVSGETWSQKQDRCCYLRAMKDSSGVPEDKIRWEGNYNRDITSVGTRELQQRLTPFQAVREPFLHSRLPQPSPVQVHPQHSGFSVSSLSSSLLAMLIAVLCSHFMLSNGDLAIFNTENQRNRNSSLSRTPFSTAALILGRRVPQSLWEQPGCSSLQEGASLGSPQPPLPTGVTQLPRWRWRALLFPTLCLSHIPCWSEPGWC